MDRLKERGRIKGFLEWKDALVREDVEEFGEEVKRPHGELWRLWVIYCRFNRD